MKAYSYMVIIMMFVITQGIQATTMFALDLRELSSNAEMIVQAKVTAIVTQWNKDSTAIFTYIRANIIDDMIGDDEDNEIIIMQPGGHIGTLILAVDGTTTYSVGEENVLFLNKDANKPNTYMTMGMFQGKYTIYTDHNNQRRVVRQPSGRATLYRKTMDDIETGDNYVLDDFKNKIIKYRTDSQK